MMIAMLTRYLLALIFLGTTLTACQQSPATDSNNGSKDSSGITLVLHGGAGAIKRSDLDTPARKLYKNHLKKALREGYAVLQDGGKATSAVERAIKVLENDSLFNAGRGSVLNTNGNVRMDAALMKGKNKQAGALASVANIRHPISGARAVLDSSKHVMLVAKGAREFALDQGIKPVDSAYLVTKARARSYHRSNANTSDHEGAAIQHLGTVGAVALDKEGNLAAGTSTGGLSGKAPGRVGDSPTIGAGTYADNATCAVSATGNGEFFMRNLIAYDVAARMAYQDLGLQEAAKTLIHESLTKAGGKGGLIALDTTGNMAMPFNTSGMFRAVKQKGANAKARIFPKR
jgi:beta-aspartyl-peptidase (threonine type)